MKPRLLANTIRHLKAEQVIFQIVRKLHPAHLRKSDAPQASFANPSTAFLQKPEILNQGKFCFLNLESSFNGWDFDGFGPLWAYNLNYMDWLFQPGITAAECAEWIDRFIKEAHSGHTSYAPYPTALRCMNWIKLFCIYPELATKERLDSLYSQLLLLSNSIERHILGNHILEDAFALSMGAYVFPGSGLGRKAYRLLTRELSRQILPDGAHFEQSPMYHCIMLERVLDCINLFKSDDSPLLRDVVSLLRNQASMMVGHLKNIVWNDNAIPLMGDSAYGIASEPEALLDYASRLGIEAAQTRLNECGYRKMNKSGMELTARIGAITATYQPGHSHADTFSYELRIGGKPFIVDTGISTYNKNSRRQYERSTKAHNTVTYDEKDSSQVWGGFRVGSRAAVRIVQDDEYQIVASHNGFGRKHIHQRSFRMTGQELEINDVCQGSKDAVSRIHFAPGIRILSADTSAIVTDVATIRIQDATDVVISDAETSVRYNRTEKSKVAEIRFRNRLAYFLDLNP